MEDVFCDISAFRFYNTPPSVLALLEMLPTERDVSVRRTLVKHPFVQHALGTPLHVLVASQNDRTHTRNIKRHLWTGDLPREALREIEGVGTFTSPEMTLLLMARSLSTTRLALAMYELCGSFAVYKVPAELDTRIKENGTERFNALNGWKQVKDFQSRPTDLWSRPPLLDLKKLQKFAAENRGAYGAKRLNDAASMVAGMTRSPLEAEAALLLSAPRRLGGYGLKFETNKAIRLTKTARKIYARDYCEADLYLESLDGRRIVDVECQGAVVHTGELATVSDANRTTALESMGISVVQITHSDVHSAERLALIAQHIASKLEVKLRPKTAKMLQAERRLRSELPANWTEIV